MSAVRNGVTVVRPMSIVAKVVELVHAREHQQLSKSLRRYLAVSFRRLNETVRACRFNWIDRSDGRR